MTKLHKTGKGYPKLDIVPELLRFKDFQKKPAIANLDYKAQRQVIADRRCGQRLVNEEKGSLYPDSLWRIFLLSHFIGQEFKVADLENYGLRCSLTYQLAVANWLHNRPFWLPHSVDFRGRAYPIPPVGRCWSFCLHWKARRCKLKRAEEGGGGGGAQLKTGTKFVCSASDFHCSKLSLSSPLHPRLSISHIWEATCREPCWSLTKASPWATMDCDG